MTVFENMTLNPKSCSLIIKFLKNERENYIAINNEDYKQIIMSVSLHCNNGFYDKKICIKVGV